MTIASVTAALERFLHGFSVLQVDESCICFMQCMSHIIQYLHPKIATLSIDSPCRHWKNIMRNVINEIDPGRKEKESAHRSYTMCIKCNLIRMVGTKDSALMEEVITVPSFTLRAEGGGHSNTENLTYRGHQKYVYCLMILR